eukprot:TRINITY_DN48309_c0_g1_i1.p1 TRINITY_DN48309_c0_g1~~TRINITY_DN48309_c0_g1_i1.p1  ORF type:complete len:355 (-),score=47.96 TRINITY_DN48309_c0_g1_i1:445-1509(-)
MDEEQETDNDSWSCEHHAQIDHMDSGSVTPSEPSSPLLTRRAAGKLALTPLRIAISTAGRDELQNAKGQLFRDSYNMFDRIGHGTFCDVHRGRRVLDSSLVAIKQMQSNDEELMMSQQREYEILRLIDHPHIVRALDSFTSRASTVIVLEYFDGIPLGAAALEQPRSRFSEMDAHTFFVLLIHAIAYLHESQIVHRDIKEQNILVKRVDKDLRLIDFNSACLLADGAEEPLTPLAGTSLWAEPDVLSGVASSSKRSDVWSTGLCLHVMLAGKLPNEYFDTNTRWDLACKLQANHAHLTASLPDDISEPCKALVRKCLDRNPFSRPSSSELIEDPWVCDMSEVLEDAWVREMHIT